MAYMEVQDESALYSDPKKVGVFGSTYGTLRAQALTPRESLTFIEQLLQRAMNTLDSAPYAGDDLSQRRLSVLIEV